MNLIQLQAGSKHFGAKVLFDDASFSLNEGEHVGVIGPNGAGKSTLFKILANQETLDAGEVTKSQQLRLAYLEQEADWNLDEKVEDFLAQNCLKPLWDLKQFGLKLGLTEAHFQAPLKNLSGGFRMRVKLLYLIGQEPNVLLLDEPTNFLDLETLLVLESFLQEFKGAFLLISHDREFLRRVTDHILEIEGGQLTKFAGNLDDYFEQKAMLEELLQKQAMNQQAKRKSILDFVSKFGAKATKARQAQSRLKALGKMEIIELRAAPSTSRIQIPTAKSTGKMILEIESADCGYPDKTVLQDVRLRLERGDHLGIVGFNGAGKSTLLKSLAEQLPLKKGQLKWGHQVQHSYYAQHSPDQLRPDETVLEALIRAAAPEVLQQEVLNMAGSLLFAGDAVQKKIRVLSGGEKSRVALGQILLQKAPLLLLDEPTNHLDFDTVEALTHALESYEGSLVTVSHDRGFIRRVATKILEIKNGRLSLYPGTYDEYVWSLQKGVLAERAEEIVQASGASKPAEGEGKFNYKEERKRIESQIKKMNKAIADADQKIRVLNQERDRLNEELLSASGEKAGRLSQTLHAVSSAIEAQEDETLRCMEQVEDLEKQLQSLVQRFQ